MLDYRGFGKSTGHIEMEEQLHADALAVWQHVAPQYAGKKVVIYGRSLGSGLAAELTHTLEKAGQHVDETILVSPYSSMRALVKDKYPFVPISLLCYPLRTDLVLPTLKSPVLLIHGDQDTLIPLSHSQMLQAFNEHSKLLIVQGAGHADIHKFAAYLEGYGAVLKGL